MLTSYFFMKDLNFVTIFIFMTMFNKTSAIYKVSPSGTRKYTAIRQKNDNCCKKTSDRYSYFMLVGLSNLAFDRYTFRKDTYSCIWNIHSALVDTSVIKVFQSGFRLVHM
eukprot:GHVU01132672.1.p1 GENE.GHVU01132672.1~~GHVU01132672.1.p1  ORF type:complete len:110 (+),score=1.48 GHVU01132672.1:181-510(+)